ncbi:hypothetical protein V8G54_026190 [Vigna mungo]|uniref:Uncharacterized protein n=1 Tax=Vigna mungo TaxID=3915 RepID=A0AAQ3RQA0_VIGMU
MTQRIIIFDDAWNQNHLSVQKEQSTHMNSQIRFICVSFWSCFLVGDRPSVMFLRCVPMRHGIFTNKKFVAHDMQSFSFRLKSITDKTFTAASTPHKYSRSLVDNHLEDRNKRQGETHSITPCYKNPCPQ